MTRYCFNSKPIKMASVIDYSMSPDGKAFICYEVQRSYSDNFKNAPQESKLAFALSNLTKDELEELRNFAFSDSQEVTTDALVAYRVLSKINKTAVEGEGYKKETFSLIEPAKRTASIRKKYFVTMFHKICLCKTDDDYRALLPQNIGLN